MLKKELVKINDVSVFKDDIRPALELAEEIANFVEYNELASLLGYDVRDFILCSRALVDLCSVIEGSVFDENN